MSSYKTVSFVFEGKEYHMEAKHYKWKSKPFIRVKWYRYDNWSGNRYPQSAVLWWHLVNDEPVFFDIRQNPKNFVQALGKFLVQELQVSL
jgi:hypothetical protein